MKERKTMYTKSRITFELLPIAINANSLSDDAWLENNSIDLLGSNFIAPQSAMRGSTYHAETLQFHCVDNRFLLTAREGEVELFSGDMIQLENTLGNTSYHVKIQQTTMPSNNIISEATYPLAMLGSAEDIWSGEEERIPSAKVTDPFSMSRVSMSGAIQQPISRTKRAEATVIGNHDPLDFLYQNKTAATHYFPHVDPSVPLAQPSGMGSDLHFLDQTPMDNLDHYLSFDDDRYYDVRSK
ncbi:MAG: hypothetical protein EXR81_00420 [Gammaproteobacteria bacterium]|nr:hypothetical protein [Gammaproteobacteria bacterium]